MKNHVLLCTLLLFFTINAPLFSMDMANKAAASSAARYNICRLCDESLIDSRHDIMTLECDHIIHEECFLAALINAECNQEEAVWCPVCGMVMTLFNELRQETASPASARQEADECPLCLEELVAEKSVKTLCGHQYCQGCWTNFIFTMNKHTVECPTCKRSLDVNNALIAKSAL